MRRDRLLRAVVQVKSLCLEGMSQTQRRRGGNQKERSVKRENSEASRSCYEQQNGWLSGLYQAEESAEGTRRTEQRKARKVC